MGEQRTGKRMSYDSVITFQQADCQKMPFENENFDVATISFGFRNFQNRQECLTEIARILKNNGQLAILEVSRANALVGIGLAHP